MFKNPFMLTPPTSQVHRLGPLYKYIFPYLHILMRSKLSARNDLNAIVSFLMMINIPAPFAVYNGLEQYEDKFK